MRSHSATIPEFSYNTLWYCSINALHNTFPELCPKGFGQITVSFFLSSSSMFSADTFDNECCAGRGFFIFHGVVGCIVHLGVINDQAVLALKVLDPVNKIQNICTIYATRVNTSFWSFYTSFKPL